MRRARATCLNIPRRHRQMPGGLLPALAAALLATGLSGCASERLQAGAPAGINLTGQWRLNPNLSDDPDKQAVPDKPTSAPLGSGRRSRRNGGIGLPPIGPGGPSNFVATDESGALASDRVMPGTADEPYADAFDAPAIAQSEPLPPVDGGPAPASAGSDKGNHSRLLQAPDRLSIVQNGAVLTVKSTMRDGTTFQDEYTAGTQKTIPYGTDSTADRAAGWRGPVFVVTTSAKKGGSREDDYGLDDEGHLIMTTQTRGRRIGKNDLVRVYDRVKGGGPE